MDLAKWLQTATSTTKLTHSIRLARLVRSCFIKNAPRFARRSMYGWSYGGYMACMSLCKSPIFKVCVAGAPVTSWDGYDTHYTERYMGTPESNKHGYKISSIFEHVHKMEGTHQNPHCRPQLQLQHLQPSTLLAYPHEKRRSSWWQCYC